MAESNVATRPGFSATPPPANTPRKINVRATLALVGVSFALLVFVAAFALVWLSVQSGAMQRRNGTAPRTAPFCCPVEAAKLFAVIDKNAAPCEDFFAYVCKNALSQGDIQRNAAQELLWNIGAGILKGTSNYSVRAAATLQAFYRSCVTEIWQPELRLKGATEAVLEIANTTRRMSHAQLLHFVLEVQFRYDLILLFVVLAETGEFYLARYLRLSDNYALYCDPACLATALATVNAHIGANTTLDEMLQWEQHFVQDYSEPKVASWYEVRAIFGGISADEFKAIFSEFQINVDAFGYVLMDPGEQLIADVQRLWNITNQPLSLCHVLVILVLDVMQASMRNDAALNEPTVHSSELCEVHLNQNDYLWRVTRVAALTSAEKDRQMHAIFEATRRSFVSYEPLRRIVAEGNDTEAFERLVSNMALLLPVDLVLPEIEVPSLPNSGFVRNFLRLRSFQYEANLELKRRGLPVYQEAWRKDRIMFLGSGRLYVTAPSYAWLSDGTSNPLLADAPVLGSRMAYSMWDKVYSRGWSGDTERAFRVFQKCVKQSQRLYEYDDSHDLFTRAMGLRISATVGATGAGNKARAEWFRMKNAWSLYRMSDAQFFYARYAYFRCTGYSAVSQVNGPTLHNADFVTAYHCQRSSKDETKTGCDGVASTPSAFGGGPGDSFTAKHVVNT
ncbi:hypothetical protein MRX96_017625 [Rhipicephalus microplus]